MARRSFEYPVEGTRDETLDNLGLGRFTSSVCIGTLVDTLQKAANAGAPPDASVSLQPAMMGKPQRVVVEWDDGRK